MATTNEMHRDHQQWCRETSFWREEVALWQRELAEVDSELDVALHAHADALRKHASAIRVDEIEAGEHEEALCLAERDEAPEVGRSSIAHVHETRRHAIDGQAHAKLKENHRRIIVSARKLLRQMQAE